MSNSQNLPFLGIIAVGGSLSEAAIAYHDAAIGQNAVAITDRGNSFLFMSNAHPDETVMSNPITGELDLRDVPQALSAVQFQSKSSAKVAARYNVCAGDDGKSGCGTHLIYDCKDVIKYCPMCNESLSSEKTDEEISDVLSFEELGDVITAPEDLEIAAQTSESAGKEDEDEEDDDEDISFNDVSDDDDDDEDYGSESSSLTDISGDAEPFDLSEMSDDEIAEFEGEDDLYTGELSESASSDDNADDGNTLISNRELEAIRDELIREARHEAHALASKSSNNMREPNEDEFVVNCDSLVAISRTQTKALNKYRALLVSKVPMSVVASSDSSMGFATLASDAKVFRHNVMTGDLIDGNSQVSTRKSPQFIESLSSVHDHSIADLYQCTSKDCAVYIVTSAQSPVHCPMCASDLKDPEDIEDAIVPVLEDSIQDEEVDNISISSDNMLDDSSIDLDDFDISSLEDDTELNNANTSISSDETNEAEATDGDEITVGNTEATKKVNVTDIRAYRDAKVNDAVNTTENAENDDVEDYEQLVASGISAQKNTVNMSLLAETVTETDNTKAEFLNIVYCGSLSSVDSNNHTVRDDTWTAFYKGTPIAFATLASSIQHKGIFHDPAFAEATVASAKVNGIKQSLTDMGFKPFVAKIKVKDNINKLVASQVEAAKAELTEKTKVEFDDYDGRLLAALSTAAVGINRGFFRNLTNPVKVALWNSLSSAGVRNPETLIDNVFSTQADSYHKTLFEKAKEIVSKPLEIQNELTAAVVGTNYTSTASSSHSYTSNQTVEDSLQQVGHPTTGLNTSNSVSVSSSAGNSENTNQMDTRILKVVSSLGRRR